ncbi:MAG: Ig-like domain-containing protein [Bacteroidota bacterium]
MKRIITLLLLLTVAPFAFSQVMITVAGNGTAGNTGDFDAATLAQIYIPKAVAVDAAGNIYIASRHVIRKINTSGVISTIAGSVGSYGYWGDGGSAISAGLYSPTGIAVDNSGNIYIADQENHRIRKINTSGTISTVAGNGISGYGGDGSAATSANLNFPAGIAVDAAGNLYIADQSNNRVRKVNTSGVISTIAGNGFMGFSGDGGAGTSARLDHPSGVAVDGSGNVFVADTWNVRIRKISTGGIITTYAGNGAVGYSGDGGSATSAAISTLISGIAVDGSDNVYIADNDNYRIRRVSGGIINTIGGTGINGFSGDGGVATSAQVGLTYGVAVASSGNIFIADGGNNRIRKICTGSLPTAGTITGTLSFCQATTTTLASSSGGAWSSGSTGVATVSSGGVVSGVAAGTARITYTVTNLCGSAFSTALVTVNPAPSAGTLSGSAMLCAPGTTTLSSTVSGGTWTSGATGVATAGATTGVINGVSAGTATISYAASNSCGTAVATRIVTVSSTVPAVAAIGGPSTVCTGNTITLTDATAGGVWSSTAAGVATITTGGIVSSVTAGTTTISYTVINGCGTSAATKAVTVGLTPATGILSGPSLVCIPATITLSSTSSGGIWSSSSATVATVAAATGVVTGVSAGTASMTYTMTSGFCSAATSTIVTVSAIPTVAPITGTGSVCQGTTITLADVTTGGAWSSAAATVAVGSATGAVGGASAGTGTVSYTVTNGCGATSVTAIVTVNPTFVGHTNIITTIAGTGLSGSTGDGGAATAARIYAIYGMTEDTAHNLYLVDSMGDIRKVTPGGVISTFLTGYEVIRAAADQLGNLYFIDNATGDLNKRNAAGVITTVAAGLMNPWALCTDYANNVYVGLIWTSTVLKFSPSGVMSVFAGDGTTSYSGDGGAATSAGLGNWVNGLAADKAGNIYISTNFPSGAYERVRKVDINGTITTVAGLAGTHGFTGDGGLATAAELNGPNSVATDGAGGLYISDYYNYRVRSISAGTNIINTKAGTGLTWYNGDNIAATTANIKPSAVLIDHSGSVIIADENYRIRKIATSAGTITGPGIVCLGVSTTLANTFYPAYSTWSSSNASVATVSSGGVVNGVSAGTATITYTVSSSCNSLIAVKTVTVSAFPTAATLSGAHNVCAGQITTLSSTAGGGTWASSSTGTATISAAGMVLGIAAGAVTISYTVTNSCGSATTTHTLTVEATPAAGSVSGNGTVCIGAAASMTATASGGTWASSNTGIATVSSSGEVTGVTAGAVTVSYTVTVGSCSAWALHTMTVIDCAAAGVGMAAGGSEQLVISPNPNSGVCRVVLQSAGNGSMKLVVTDITGRSIAEISATVNKPADLQLTQPGIYFVTATTATGTYTTKVVVSGR